MSFTRSRGRFSTVYACVPVELHLRIVANNLVMTAASTRLLAQNETIHVIEE